MRTLVESGEDGGTSTYSWRSVDRCRPRLCSSFHLRCGIVRCRAVVGRSSHDNQRYISRGAATVRPDHFAAASTRPCIGEIGFCQAPPGSQFIADTSTTGSHPARPRPTDGLHGSRAPDACQPLEAQNPAITGCAEQTGTLDRQQLLTRLALELPPATKIALELVRYKIEGCGFLEESLGIPRGIPRLSTVSSTPSQHSRAQPSCPQSPQPHCSTAPDQGICLNLPVDSSRNPWGILEESTGYPRFAAQCAQPGKNGGTTRGLLEDGF